MPPGEEYPIFGKIGGHLEFGYVFGRGTLDFKLFSDFFPKLGSVWINSSIEGVPHMICKYDLL